MMKAVLFDLNGTLIKRSLSDTEVFYKIAASGGIDVSLNEVRKALLKARNDLRCTAQVQCGKIPLLDFYRLWYSSILENLNIEDKEDVILKEIYNRWITICGITLYPDVQWVLTYLKEKGVKTGIVSSAYQEEILNMAKAGGLDAKSFDVIVGADTVGQKKPHPAGFLYALKVLKVKPCEALYVGNSLENDYRAAQKVGMNSVLLVREDTAPGKEVTIKTLFSLPDFLGIGTES